MAPHSQWSDHTVLRLVRSHKDIYVFFKKKNTFTEYAVAAVNGIEHITGEECLCFEITSSAET